MNTQTHTTEIPRTAESGRTLISHNANPVAGAESAGARSDAGNDTLRTVALAPAFIALADKFGMVPERLAERVIAAFAATKPARIVVKARAASGLAVH